MNCSSSMPWITLIASLLGRHRHLERLCSPPPFIYTRLRPSWLCTTLRLVCLRAYARPRQHHSCCTCGTTCAQDQHAQLSPGEPHHRDHASLSMLAMPSSGQLQCGRTPKKSSYLERAEHAEVGNGSACYCGGFWLKPRLGNQPKKTAGRKGF